MGYKFGANSIKKLKTCHVALQLLMSEAIKTSPIDFTIVCGHRGEKEQNEAFRTGRSKLQWPKGKHNKMPSEAVDIAPYPRLFESSQEEWELLNNHIKKTAQELKINVRWGGDWNGNGTSKDEKFLDIPHWELKK